MNASQLLDRKTHKPRPSLAIAQDISVPLARTHEACGNARRSFALWVASKTKGPVIWIRPGWTADQLNPPGVLDWMEPGRLMLTRCRRAEDLLWCMEEALRASAVELVVAELPGPPALTPVRRLHLAAETGAAEGAHSPIGLLLTPGDGGAQGVETRWCMTAAHKARRTAWHLARTRARTDPPRDWMLERKDGVLSVTPKAAALT